MVKLGALENDKTTIRLHDRQVGLSVSCRHSAHVSLLYPEARSWTVADKGDKAVDRRSRGGFTAKAI